jgi:PleD family two-component response regulator
MKDDYCRSPAPTEMRSVADPQDQTRRPWARESAKILIVDDRPENLLAFRVILEQTGEDLVLAHSGYEALEQVAKHDFAAILLDVNMPGIDGFDTAKRIRNNKRAASTPIIFLTAFADDFHEAEADSHGAVDFIETPVVPGILRAKVRMLAEHFRMRRELERRLREEG